VVAWTRWFVGALALSGAVAAFAVTASAAAGGVTICNRVVLATECVARPASYLAVVTPLERGEQADKLALQAIGVVGGGGYPGAGIVAVDPPTVGAPATGPYYGVVGGPASSNSDILSQASIAAGVPGFTPSSGADVWAPGVTTCGWYQAPDPNYQQWLCY